MTRAARGDRGGAGRLLALGLSVGLGATLACKREGAGARSVAESGTVIAAAPPDAGLRDAAAVALPPPEVDALAPPIRTGPCPTGVALERTARAAWQTATAATIEATCIPARMRQAVWIVSGIARDIPGESGETNERHTAVLSLGDAGELVAELAETGLSWREVDYGELPSYVAVDLDGDGADELLTTTASSRGGELVTTISVTRLADGELEAGDPIQIGYDDDAAAPDPPGPTSCSSTVAVAAARTGKGKLVVVTAAAATGDRAVAKESCLPRGVHRYAVAGVELRAVK